MCSFDTNMNPGPTPPAILVIFLMEFPLIFSFQINPHFSLLLIQCTGFVTGRGDAYIYINCHVYV